MQHYDRILEERFPIRKSAEQKQAFLDYLTAELKAQGYAPQLEINGVGKSRNLVVGNPEKSAVVLCAHYDTPARKWLGNLLVPTNIPVYLGYQALNMLVLLLLSLVLYLIAWQLIGKMAVWVFLISYLAMLLWQVLGTPNRHNRNQSSGLAVMMEIMACLPEKARARVSFVFFDRGEEFTMGAKAYAKEHLQVQYTRLLLQLDAVGNGRELLLIPRKAARKCTGYQRIVRALEDMDGMHFQLGGTGMNICPGDYRNFQCGMILLACIRNPVIGLCIPYLHSPKDTVTDGEQLEKLTAVLTQALEVFGGSAQNHVDEKL